VLPGGEAVSNPSQRFLDLQVKEERERVAKEKEQASQRLRARVAPILGVVPDVPAPDVVPLHQTPRPDGLAVDTSIASYAFKRWSPFRKRWPDVLAFDERVRELEHQQAAVNQKLVEAHEELAAAEAADQELLATWVANPSGTRPQPEAPGAELRIRDLEREREALELAVRRVLDDKSDFVAQHRARLIREARKATAKAVKQLHEKVEAVEQARAEAVDCVVAQHWAKHFPGEDANAGSLRLALIKGGRVVKALNGYLGQIVSTQALELLREDADWIGRVLEPKEDDGELDVLGGDPFWEQSPEGREAVVRANKKAAEMLQPRHTRVAGWGD
jgi:hypothetical protein